MAQRITFNLVRPVLSALQEADLIGITPLPISFEFDWIGVKSTWQGILAQLSVLMAFLVFTTVTGSKQKISSVTSRISDVENPGVTPSKPD